MEECKFCEEEFGSKQELHVHWGEEHQEELNSHDEEKVKKAERKREERKEQKMRQRKRYAGYGLGGLLALAFVAIVGSQLVNTMGGGSTDLDLEGQPTLGDENASVTVVAFEDFKCPFCRQFTTSVYPQLKADYIETGKAKFVFVNYPLPLGQDSYTAAVASECVYRQDKQQFWDFKTAVFRNQGPESQRWATTDRLMEIARQSTSGLNYDSLRTCIENEETMPEVTSDRRLARSNGVSSTPTVFVNGEQVSNPLDYGVLSSAIDSELE